MQGKKLRCKSFQELRELPKYQVMLEPTLFPLGGTTIQEAARSSSKGASDCLGQQSQPEMPLLTETGEMGEAFLTTVTKTTVIIFTRAASPDKAEGTNC